jgi:glycosyltransferase involved in cell wall biosynthesis
MHDFVMHHFFMVRYLHDRKTPAEYVSEMERSYGAAGREIAERSVAGGGEPIWLTDDVARFPLFERIVDCARGVFVHSQFHRQQIEKRYIGDVDMAYLPYRMPPVGRPRAVLLDAFGIPADKVVAVSTGIVHPVKRIERVLRAIGANRALADRLVYVVIGSGPEDYVAKLQSMVFNGDISASVRFLGYMPDNVLHEFLGAADFAVNLRFPNSEGGSLSLVEQMSFGKPVLAVASGVYGEMPDTAVRKISPGDDGDELARAIEELALDGRARDGMAGHARAFAQAHFNAQTYARRLLEFLSRQSAFSHEPIRRSLREVSAILSAGQAGAQKASCGTEIVVQHLSQIAGSHGVRAHVGPPLRTLGIWLGFEHATPLHREGITRFLCYLIQHLVERHGIGCEIWCYAVNESSVRESFASLLSDRKIADAIRIVHEKNYVEVLNAAGSPYGGWPNVDVDRNNLHELANRFSAADCFLLGICYLDNALPLVKPIFIPLHDLIVLENYRSFLHENDSFRPYVKKTREAVEQFNGRKAFFFCNSEHVRRNQLMKYIRHVDERRTKVVYLPVNVPADIHQRIPRELDVRRQYGLVRPYFFYPTQIRQHKNVLTLLRAFKVLVNEGSVVQLVLTGTPEHVPAVHDYIKRNGLDKYMILAKDVGEEMLYALHAYAAATVVPTLFEGGFPWQALEAMLMDTPAILSNIAAVTERLSTFNIDAAGLLRFDPYDVPQLVRHMHNVLQNREAVVLRQATAKTRLFEYRWADVARAYYQVMSDHLQSGSRHAPIESGDTALA